MNELWAIAVALPHEAEGLRPRFAAAAQTRYRQLRITEGRLGETSAILAVTGMGPQIAARSARFLFEQYPVTHLLATGYCGGLQEGLSNGDAVLAERCAPLEHPEGGWLSDLPLLRRAEAALREADLHCRSGVLLTAPQPVLKFAEKEALAARSRALAVDMEGAAILQAAAESGKKIASVTVRFIVDALGDDLTDTGPFLDENAELKPLSLVRELIRRPKLLQELPGLGRKAARARASLTRFVLRFFGVA